MLRVADVIQRTDTGLARRGNEDSSFARAPLFVVADGMGGAQSGEVASGIAVQTFEQGLPESGAAEERLAARVHEANALIHQRSLTEQHNAGMGTTVTAALLDGEHLAIAHVGDSRAYLFRDDELKRLTQDHSLVDELVRQGKLTEEQAAEHPQRSIITRALGPEATVEVDTWSYPARAGDVVLLCSDGLTSMISEARIAEVLRTTPRLDAAAEQLIHDANAAGGRDNITVVLFRVEEVGSVAGVDQATIVAPQPDGAPAESPTLAADVPPVAPPPDLPAAGASRAGSRSALAERTRRPRLARTQGPPTSGTTAPPRSRLRSERLIKPVSALLATLIVLFLIGGGGYIATRQLYFLGTNVDGIVTVYRGLPYDVLGIRLYETFYTSGVPAALIPQDRRSTVLNHHLISQGAATKLAMQLELGDITK
ncbi:MAG TPA: Stp1/IreP family PP2C-type Ser/Thr phosphatase [Solirubrobacteraceae bacterium]|jgi:protein phosphatase|nr:Stp1/IreP family PP2C-type Ser/Thr phosphatase [Solirubrobacteraceae bacterium]